MIRDLGEDEVGCPGLPIWVRWAGEEKWVEGKALEGTDGFRGPVPQFANRVPTPQHPPRSEADAGEQIRPAAFYPLHSLLWRLLVCPDVHASADT